MRAMSPNVRAWLLEPAGGVRRGHDFGINDLLSAGAIVESFVRPVIVQRLPGAVGGFGDHRHGLVHAFNAPSDNLGFEPIVTSCHVAFPVARQGKNRTSGLAGVPPPLKRMPQVKGVRGAVICCKGNIRAEGG